MGLGSFSSDLGAAWPIPEDSVCWYGDCGRGRCFWQGRGVGDVFEALHGIVGETEGITLAGRGTAHILVEPRSIHIPNRIALEETAEAGMVHGLGFGGQKQSQGEGGQEGQEGGAVHGFSISLKLGFTNVDAEGTDVP